MFFAHLLAGNFICRYYYWIRFPAPVLFIYLFLCALIRRIVFCFIFLFDVNLHILFSIGRKCFPFFCLHPNDSNANDPGYLLWISICVGGMGEWAEHFPPKPNNMVQDYQNVYGYYLSYRFFFQSHEAVFHWFCIEANSKEKCIEQNSFKFMIQKTKQMERKNIRE